MRHILLICLSLLIAAPSLAATGDTITTILIAGLKHVDREVLLSDLGIHEGDSADDNLARKLQARARELVYISSFQVEVQTFSDGLHLNLRVQERPRLQIQPIIGTLDDGDLVGGMRLRSFSLFRRGESWDATVLVGSMADLSLQMSGLPLFGPFSLAIDLRLQDWENPFLDAEHRNWHYLGGLRTRLPLAGYFTLLAGGEHHSTRPYRGILENEGEDPHFLFTGRLRQPTGLAGIALVARGEMRKPSDFDSFFWGEVGIDQHIRPGRWRFHTRLLQGGASFESPAIARPFLSKWSWFHAYEPGELETRDYSFASFRGDIRLFGLPMRMSRRGPEVSAPVSAFFLLAGAQHRMDTAGDWSFAGEGGLGVSLIVPDYGLRISAGGFVTREEEFKFIFILEDALP